MTSSEKRLLTRERAMRRKLADTLDEIRRRTCLLVHQNTGRWDMTVEHDARTYGVCEGNVRLADDALEANARMDINQDKREKRERTA